MQKKKCCGFCRFDKPICRKKILQFARSGIRQNMQLTNTFGLLGIVLLLQLLPLIQLDLTTAAAFLLLSGNATELLKIVRTRLTRSNPLETYYRTSSSIKNFGLPSRTSHDFSIAYNGLHNILGCRIAWLFLPKYVCWWYLYFFPLLECRSFFFVSRYTPWTTKVDFVFDFIWFALLSGNSAKLSRTLRKFQGGTSEFSKFAILMNVWEFIVKVPPLKVTPGNPKNSPC